MDGPVTPGVGLPSRCPAPEKALYFFFCGNVIFVLAVAYFEIYFLTGLHVQDIERGVAVHDHGQYALVLGFPRIAKRSVVDGESISPDMKGPANTWGWRRRVWVFDDPAL